MPKTHASETKLRTATEKCFANTSLPYKFITYRLVQSCDFCIIYDSKFDGSNDCTTAMGHKLPAGQFDRRLGGSVLENGLCLSINDTNTDFGYPGYRHYVCPSRLDIILNSELPSVEVQKANSWNPADCSYNIYVKEDDPLTFHRYPVAQSTDSIRGKVGYTEGFHVWKVTWPVCQRGTHAVIGVATAKAPLCSAGYCSLVGSSADSWGWDIGRKKLYHDWRSETASDYPNSIDEIEDYVVPQDFLMILDMDEGTLSFFADDTFLGVAFEFLRGSKVYPIVSAVWGHCEVTLQYLGGLAPRPLCLSVICRREIRKQMKKPSRENIDGLELPELLKDYVLYQ
ncbi:SPRY domain-containing SOCS box protein 4 [Trichinella spiralis]|uniref:SPRY domain-containing SOCS box protein 4 n=1 Tax=Trichinella spiralis TaxID=6334 RepID=A0A0V1BRX1_TRISP|nr:SPRY domain-containing SOCS box protein 4 [Trichinella spiralis]